MIPIHSKHATVNKAKRFEELLLVFCAFFTLCSAHAQNVGINTTGATPSTNAILDLNTGNSNNVGLIIPNVVLSASLTTFSPPIIGAATANDVGMIVYNSSIATSHAIGYYYWSGTTWVAVGGGGGLSACGGAATSYLPYFTSSSTLCNSVIWQGANSNIAIGNTSPSASAILDLSNATNQGFLAPQVSLTAANSASPVAAAVAGMVVYNKTVLSAQAPSGNTNVNVAPGYYYNDGANWQRLGPNKFYVPVLVTTSGGADYSIAGTAWTASTGTPASLVGAAPTVAAGSGAQYDGTLITWVATSNCILTAVNVWVQTQTATAETADLEIVKYTETSGSSTVFTNGVLLASNAAISIVAASGKAFYNPTVTLANPCPIISKGDFIIIYLKSSTDVLSGNITMEFQSMQ